jgi:glycerophosphoryl diester phosphodiesterase
MTTARLGFLTNINLKMNKIRILILSLLATLTTTLTAQTAWHNPMEGDVPALFGRAWNQETGKGSFARVPQRLQKNLPKKVYELAQNSAGLSVKFVTNSRNISVRFKVADKANLHNMSDLNESGADLYALTPKGTYHWVGNHLSYKFGKSAQDTTYINFSGLSVNGDMEYQLYLPNYNSVTALEVGVDGGSTFRFLRPTTERPVVVYGSSIIQGASPSRPGLSITNVVQRNLRKPVVNLGFSGNCLLEPALFRALAEIDASAYVIDPIPNSYRLQADEIVKRTTEGVTLLRQQRSAPIILVECYAASDSVMRNNSYARYQAANLSLRKAYQTLVQQGVKDLYLLGQQHLDLGEEGMIEGTHPNDLGCMVYAEAYTRMLRSVIGTKTIAHRGYWDTEGSAQNSIASLMKADSIQTYGSEFDVWITRDGQVVVNHDPEINGITIETTAYKDLKDQKLRNGERISLLKDYLAAGTRCSTKLILEVKKHKSQKREDKCVDEAIKMIMAARLGSDRVEFISFSLEACKRLHARLKDYNVAYLNGDLAPAEIKALGFTGIDYQQKVINQHPEWVQQCHDLGLTVNVWTVNKTADMQKDIKLGVDFITTNKPVECMELTRMK